PGVDAARALLFPDWRLSPDDERFPAAAFEPPARGWNADGAGKVVATLMDAAHIQRARWWLLGDPAVPWIAPEDLDRAAVLAALRGPSGAGDFFQAVDALRRVWP